MTRRAPPLALILVILLTGLLPAAAAAADPPLPSSMAAVGDSITRAASTAGSLGVDAPQNSWATGTSTTVNSHARRLGALGAQLTTHNLAVSGAKMENLDAQMANVVTVQPDYVTVLIGGNDLCTDTVTGMTDVGVFGAQFQTAMARLMDGTQDTGTLVYVVSIPNVYQLWHLFKGSWWARFIWSSADICQSLLANPTSNQQADIDRREAVRQRNIAYNLELKNVCAAYAARCRFDNNAAYNTTFTTSDVSGDYFHPSTAGQAKLASVSWAAGYTWSTGPQNAPPTASFTSSCVDLVCSFTDTSTDGDGAITARQWSFGDGTGSTQTSPSHTYGAGGTRTVTLTVTDDDGATGSTSSQVTVTAPEEPPPPDPEGTMSVADLDGASAAGKRQAWTATVTIRVVDDAGGPLAGAAATGSWETGGSSTCTTNAAGSCSVTVSINAKKALSTTYSVTGVVLSGFTYVAGDNTDPDDDSDGTAITITRP